MQELDQEQNQPVTYVKQFPLELFTPESQPVAKQFICCLCKGVSVQISFDICGHFFCNSSLNTSKLVIYALKLNAKSVRRLSHIQWGFLKL